MLVAYLACDVGSMVALEFFYWAIGYPKFRYFIRLRCALKISCDLKSIATWEVDGIGLATGVLVSMYLLFAFPVTSVLCILNWFDIPLLSLVSKLYEICAANHWKPPVFECCKEEGPCHCRMILAN
ncbi:uncharacterized protein LOC131634974 isoform X2 [Vicia villosa]|uniref:uncharacterized protein LOC131622515 isoform X2 n=1 Tax=Vicia villosa TaxID=3911 RepID=UPI00273BCF40|nr:uncharacterized protein LOC131622515 isoform X2 [Vicia villosa]XP_058761583.1 uncharacterized protein LOC131634974 isoform X2 [Vicia villosa]